MIELIGGFILGYLTAILAGRTTFRFGYKTGQLLTKFKSKAKDVEQKPKAGP